ncbi:MAG: hypothetical protein ACH350_09225 [Parachlamydiaceae bacterium]
MDTVEKFYKKDAKNDGFSKSMKFPKKSNEGAFQFKIAEGIPFTIKEGQTKARFHLINGHLTLF